LTLEAALKVVFFLLIESKELVLGMVVHTCNFCYSGSKVGESWYQVNSGQKNKTPAEK
jgi:hypothetical protein